MPVVAGLGGGGGDVGDRPAEHPQDVGVVAALVEQHAAAGLASVLTPTVAQPDALQVADPMRPQRHDPADLAGLDHLPGAAAGPRGVTG